MLAVVKNRVKMAESRNGTLLALTPRCSPPALAFLGLLEAEAVAIDLEDLRAMDKAIDERHGASRMRKDLGPIVERLIGTKKNRFASLIAAC